MLQDPILCIFLGPSQHVGLTPVKHPLELLPSLIVLPPDAVQSCTIAETITINLLVMKVLIMTSPARMIVIWAFTRGSDSGFCQHIQHG